MLNLIVFSGMNRFGYTSASDILTQKPDISVYAKILTGGLLPLSATLASTSIFRAFLSDKKIDALLHGHSYTANPIGCSVALKAIEMSETRVPRTHLMEGGGAGWGEIEGDRWSLWSLPFLQDVSRNKGVKGVMGMGTVLAIELEDVESGQCSAFSLLFSHQVGDSRR